MDRKVILYRGREFEEDELPAARAAGFYCTSSRLDVQPGDLVVGRYSVLPFYGSLESDLLRIGARLVNIQSQHRHVADIGLWYPELMWCTPKTYYPGEWADMPAGGSFVVKGETNSKKFLWSTHMFAPTRAHVEQVVRRLLDDSLLQQQQLYVRDYVPLRRLDEGLNGLPITVEYRFFVCRGKVLCGGFYWSSHAEYLRERAVDVPDASCVPRDFLDRVVDAVGSRCDFYALDVAMTEAGEWIVVELNDGQMSGLSENDPQILYPALMRALT